MSKEIIEQQSVEDRIFIIRGHKVMISTHLAQLYGVKPKVLMQAVNRNIERFPKDFMFKLTKEEARSLRSQIVTLEEVNHSNSKRGFHSKYLPYAFTEQGVAMLSSVLRSKKAIQVNIAIMRAFIKFRGILEKHRELYKKIEDMEKKYDAQFRVVFRAIKELMSPKTPKPKPQIGFRPNK